ncbi:MAG: hypothetical protein ACQERF_02920 [Actinomycetota bacterium]
MRPFITGTCLLSALMLAAGPSTAVPPADDDAERELSMLEHYWESATVRGGRQSTLRDTLLASAQPDECFADIGEPHPEGTYDEDGTLTCPEGSQPKVNQAYVWGLTKSGDDLWFGTGPNILCLVLSTFHGMTDSNITDSWVCEGEDSWYRTNNPLGASLPPQLGDWRPPDIFAFDQGSDTLIDLETELDDVGRTLLNMTLGIRSAGSIDDRVFFAGPMMPEHADQELMLSVFVFDTDGTYIGAEVLPGFTNIRKWVEVSGELYTGVGTGDGGQILRYTGSTAEDPFQYEVVGTLASEPAELALHDGRLFAATWPTAGGIAGLWMSPALGSDKKLTGADEEGWTPVWSAADYEPDPVTARTYGGGALHSQGGKLYWGTMHVPFVAALAHAQVYAPYYEEAGTTALVADVLGTHRAISIFRGDNFETTPSVELLYGEAKLPVFDPATTSWALQPNAMGVKPVFGHSGFGNLFNNYTWTMARYRGALYVGTMDWSYLLAEGAEAVLERELGIPAGTEIPLPDGVFGADLWRFTGNAKPAVAERTDGVGNHASYGIRTMVSDDALYLGMANPMNLLTDPGDDQPQGGWQLLRLSQGKAMLAPSGRR